MKWSKKDIPNMHDFLKTNTVDFLDKEKVFYDPSHDQKEAENKVTATAPSNSEFRAKKSDIVKLSTHNFLENEKVHNNMRLQALNIQAMTESIPKSENANELKLANQQDNLTPTRRHFLYYDSDNSTNPRWVHRDIRTDSMTMTDSRTDYNGKGLKKYTTTCYLKPVVVPTWYTESVEIKLNSTKKVYTEKVYFKTKLEPSYWSEHMTTEVKPKSSRKMHSEDRILPVSSSPINDQKYAPVMGPIAVI